MNEQWAEITGFEGVYSVSTRGRVRNNKSGRFLKPNTGLRGGERTINLNRGTESRAHVISDLVRQAFPPRPYRMQVGIAALRREQEERVGRAGHAVREDHRARLEAAEALAREAR